MIFLSLFSISTCADGVVRFLPRQPEPQAILCVIHYGNNRFHWILANIAEKTPAAKGSVPDARGELRQQTFNNKP